MNRKWVVILPTFTWGVYFIVENVHVCTYYLDFDKILFIHAKNIYNTQIRKYLCT